MEACFLALSTDVEFVVITLMGGVEINRGKFLTGCGVCRYQGD